ARKAFLSGLSPKENRTVPPLRYDVVHRLRRDFPDLELVINGGIDTEEGIRAHFAAGLDGVMIGRKAYADPWWLADLDRQFLGVDPARPVAAARAEVVEAMAAYAGREAAAGVRLHHVSRHMLGLYHGQPGARAWRRALTLGAARTDAGPAVLLDALRLVEGQQAAMPATGTDPRSL
ncbi:MAG: tRNA-dihydrouridine synthase, partial [Gammaproteobacteria bacterium]|nr:tRNA-dihydrouridine synthase [Gammaproteobacteria bacterium]